MNQKGFGFLSMMILVVSLTIAATFVVSQIVTDFSTTEMKITNKRVEAIRDAINAYVVNHQTAGLVPVAGTGGPANIAALLTTDGDACVFDNTPANPGYLTLQGWCGPYINSDIQEDPNAWQRDGWGSQIQYNAGTLVLTSFGPNRADDAGGGDDIVYNP